MEDLLDQRYVRIDEETFAKGIRILQVRSKTPSLPQNKLFSQRLDPW